MDKDWQDAYENPDEMAAAHKRALLDKIHHKMNRGQGRTLRMIFIGASAAAVLLIFLFIRFNGPGPVRLPWRELASNESSRKFTLEDSSVVWLAPHTVLYARQRTVRLQKGTAFFSIAKDEQHQFSVIVGPQQIAVLGTAFTIRTIDSVDLQLILKEGKVALDNNSGRRLLTAGQQVNTSHAITGTIQNIDPSDADWWLQSKVRWHNVTVWDMLRRVEDYYQVHLNYGDIDRQMKVTLTWDMTIPLKENLIVLNALTGYNIQ
jgi:transmembrane sensor